MPASRHPHVVDSPRTSITISVMRGGEGGPAGDLQIGKSGTNSRSDVTPISDDPSYGKTSPAAIQVDEMPLT